MTTKRNNGNSTHWVRSIWRTGILNTTISTFICSSRFSPNSVSVAFRTAVMIFYFWATTMFNYANVHLLLIKHTRGYVINVTSNQTHPFIGHHFVNLIVLKIGRFFNRNRSKKEHWVIAHKHRLWNRKTSGNNHVSHRYEICNGSCCGMEIYKYINI